MVQGRHPFTPELLLILGYARLPLECCPLSSRPRRLPVWHCQALPHLPPRSLVLTFTSFLKSRVFPHAPLAHSLTACFPELAALCLCVGWGRRRGISRGPSLGRRRGISREPSLVNGQCIWETLCVVMTLFPSVGSCAQDVSLGSFRNLPPRPLLTVPWATFPMGLSFLAQKRRGHVCRPGLELYGISSDFTYFHTYTYMHYLLPLLLIICLLIIR